MGGCVVISDKAQRTRKWALSWAQYRRRDTYYSLWSGHKQSEGYAHVCGRLSVLMARNLNKVPFSDG